MSLTRRLTDAGKLLGITVDDHVILTQGKGNYVKVITSSGTITVRGNGCRNAGHTFSGRVSSGSQIFCGGCRVY
ncbi:MAG: hypothetical protein JXR20_04585 [Balneola sp.]